MDIQVRRLREALEALAPAVPRKTALPVTTQVLLGDGKAVATDLEVAAIVDLPEAGEAFLLPHKGALEFLRYTPGNKTARITPARGKVSLAVDGTETTLDAGDPQDFPPIPDNGGESEGVLDGDALVKALTAVLPCAAGDKDRPVLAGVYLATGDTVEAVTADGFRLAWERIPGRLSGPPMNIPARAVEVLEHLWKRGATPELGDAKDVASVALAKRLIRLDWGKDRLRLRFGRMVLVAKLIQGTFPNYRQLIPTETAPGVTVFAEDMDRALRQVRRVAEDGSGIVRLVWEGDRLLVSARGEDIGETSVPIPARLSVPGRAALSGRYLLDYFRGRSGAVTIAPSQDGKGPVTFSHRGTPHILIMPMHVVW